MEEANCDPGNLGTQIRLCEARLADLRGKLASVEQQATIPHPWEPSKPPPEEITSNLATSKWPLKHEEYKRYGRQMIMPEVGLQGDLFYASQLYLKSSRVLIVGVGGLGCPAAAYLAGAGVGTIGLIDGDTVETSNLHRQILHNSSKVGMTKVDSAIDYLVRLNPYPQYTAHPNYLTNETAIDVMKSYDLVLDCTDRPVSRYLVSDAAVIAGIPLVTASALRTEGQMMTLNYPPSQPGKRSGGPCYRCIFPQPPPPEAVIGCGEGGILGPVVGVMGVLMAMESLRILVAGSSGEGGAPATTTTTTATLPKNDPEPRRYDPPKMLFLTAFGDPLFRTVRLRPARPHCVACSPNATITAENLATFQYSQFCGQTSPTVFPNPIHRISANKIGSLPKHSSPILVDVRPRTEFDICHLPGSISIPYEELTATETLAELKAPMQRQPNAPIYAICRFGNDSQLAAQLFREKGLDENGRTVGDVIGGLQAWRTDVDPTLPEY